MGFYNQALLTTENAARVAAFYASAGSTQAADSSTACNLAVQELSFNPNMSGVTTCGGSSPVSVSATLVTGPDGVASSAAKVTVIYTTVALFPIPGILTGQITMARTVTMKLRGS